MCSAVLRQFVIQYIAAKELAESGCCQVNHLVNYVKGNGENTEIYFRRISLFTVSLNVLRSFRMTSYHVTCYKVKYRSVPRRFCKLGNYTKLRLHISINRNV